MLMNTIMKPHPDFEILVESHLQFLEELYRSNSMAPIMAYLNREGEVLGLAVTAEPNMESLSVEEAMKPIYDRLDELSSSGELLAFVLFRAGTEDPAVIPEKIQDAASIVGLLGHIEGFETRVVITFRRIESGGVILDTPVYEDIGDKTIEED